MSRRRVVLYVSLGLVLVLLALGGVGTYVLLGTGWGQGQVRDLVRRQLAAAIRGPVYVGHISGSYLDGITIDSLEIRGPDDSLFMASGKVSLRYDIRDLIDRRLLFNRAVLQNPTIYLRQFDSGHWNYDSVFRKGASGPRPPGPRYGDFVVLDSVTLKNATFLLTKPWAPDDSLRGAPRDSAIADALHGPRPEIRRRGKSFARTWRWTHIDADVSHARLNDPDSAGHEFVVTRLAAVEADPPFVFHDVAGKVRVLGDSVWISLSKFALPGSRGSGSGKVVWGSDLPVRWDVHIIGDTVSLADVAWVYPTLPTTGGGSVVLDIESERNLDIVDYRLTRMDVRTTKSHVRGAMTFAVGGPVLAVRDVYLTGDPVDFALLRTFNGQPFPVDWQGKIQGTVVARGGPLTHFVVDSSHMVFQDAHVPGAVSEVRGRGELNILQPALTEFHDFLVTARSLDLRTVEFLYPTFPRLAGTVAGTATLDSSWLDVRFRSANMRYRAGDAPVSHVSGSGRVTYGERAMTYDVALRVDSLSLLALRQSYPHLPVTGSVTGPITARGTADSLMLDAELDGPAGSFTYNGFVDVDTPFVSAHGHGRMVALNPALAFAADSIPAGSLSGTYDVQAGGDSLATLVGSASVALERSEFDRVQIFNSLAHFRFGQNRVHIDTLILETSAARFKVDSGALGLRAGITDSLFYEIHVDSLGGLRPFLATQAALKTGVPDSLAGSIDLDTGVATGNLEHLSVRGVARGHALYINKDRGASATIRYDFSDVLRAPRGLASLTLDTLVIGGVRIDSIGVSANLLRTAAPGTGLRFAGTYAAGVLSDNGPTLMLGGSVTHAAGETQIGIDSGFVDLITDQWRLARRGVLTVAPDRIAIDTLVMQNTSGGRVLVAGLAPDHATVSMRVAADSIPMHDVATLFQIPDTLSGWGAMHLDVAGTREAPTALLDASAHDLKYGAVDLSRMALGATYGTDRAQLGLRLERRGQTTLQVAASLPMELTLFSARLLDDSLSGSVRADSADFAIAEAFVPQLTNAQGRVVADLRLGGTWHHPTLDGELAMHDAQTTIPAIGVTLKGLNVDLVASARQDRVTLRTLSAYNALTSPADNVSLGGYVDLTDRDNPQFDLYLKAHEFRAIDKRTLARLDISTAPHDSIALTGRQKGSVLSGTINIVRGAIYIPEHDLADKQLIPLSAEDLAGIDTTQLNTHVKLPSPPSALLRDMTVRAMAVNLGDDVWLRSSEANVKLSGTLNVRLTQVATVPTGFSTTDVNRSAQTRTVPRLALDGTLTAERGTYTLSLGPIQREFQVQSGTITYYGTTDLNPNVNITAQYTVRQVNRPDVNVVATLSGFLYPGPTLDLQSGETYTISQSDLVSYLCCGVPSFELGTNQSSLQTAAQVLLPTAGSVLARALHRQLGSTFDVLQFQAGATDELETTGPANSNSYRDFFSGARLGGSRQITNNLYFSINTGLCQISNSQSSTGESGAMAFFNQLESKLQYRFSPWTSTEIGLEPPSSALLCGRTQRGLVPTPQQWGLSLTHLWRW